MDTPPRHPRPKHYFLLEREVSAEAQWWLRLWLLSPGLR